MIDWHVEGFTFGGCNCAYGCPCQFESLPTHGNCRGFEVLQIDQGHFGEVDLTGLKLAVFYAWPGPIFEGRGELQPVIDESANESQRDALIRITRGEETEEAATHWWVFCAMSETIHDTLFAPIDFEVDMEARRARANIPGILKSTGSPILSPATGEEHRVRIQIPDGIEFELAEMGSLTANATGAISLDLDGTYAQFNYLKNNGSGVVRG
jgi:hypothetical protein